MLINGIEVFELARESVSPTFRFGADSVTAQRKFTVPWPDFSKAVKALRGNTIVSADKQYFERTSPYQFYWQEMDRQFTCTDVTEGITAGMPRTTTGAIDTTIAQSASLVYDENMVGVADSAHITANFAVVPYAIADDDDIDDPITPTADGELWYEWDRYTEWDVDFSSALISVPQGAYKYFASQQPVNIPIRIPVSEAKITATIYGLPIIPPAAFYFNGACNDDDFSFYLQPRDGASFVFFEAAAETLLFLYAKSVKRMTATGQRLYDVTLQFSYRQYGHNTTPYYNPTTKQVTFERFASNVTSLATAKADNSAPFRLRNFGYFWTPRIPPQT